MRSAGAQARSLARHRGRGKLESLPPLLDTASSRLPPTGVALTFLPVPICLALSAGLGGYYYYSKLVDPDSAEKIYKDPSKLKR